MNPHIVEQKNTKGETLTFTLEGVNVSIANAIRRTILSDIPTVVFKTSPYEECKANIFTNTTRLNNEILKQRLSCIPIHITDYQDINLKNYLLEVKEENRKLISPEYSEELKNIVKGCWCCFYYC